MKHRRIKQFVVGALAAAVILHGFGGCSVRKNQVEPQEPEAAAPAPQEVAVQRTGRQITGIHAGGDAANASVLIQGTEGLMYTAVKSPFANGVVLYFPETGLAAGLQKSQKPQSAVVEEILASESGTQRVSSRVEIRLKKDMPYEVEKQGSALYVFLGRGQAASAAAAPAREPEAPVQAASPEPMPAEPMVQPVEAKPAPEPVTMTMQKEAPAMAAAAPLEPGLVESAPKAPVPAYDGSIWLTRVDFLQKPAGRSSIRVQLSHPVDYRITKPEEKRLLLSLPGVSVPKEQQRPLITTRFESAADRIVPYAKGPSDAAVSIELRQMVAYHVEQTAEGVLINLEASDIPPRPLAQASLPRWESVMLNEEPLPGPGEAAAGEPGAGLAEYAGFEEGGPATTTEFMDAIADDLRGGETTSQVNYTGEKIALDFYKTDIKNVFRILKEVSGLNFAIDRDVEGEVTLTIDKPVPWDQVLHLVLKMNQLGMTRMGNIIRIAPQVVLDEEAAAVQARLDGEKARIQAVKDSEQEKRELEEAKKRLQPMVTEFISVNYTTAEDLLKHVESVKSEERGSVDVDKRTNTIIMTDTEENIKRAREIVSRLDRVTAQVQIEARVVEATTTFSREVGVGWSGESGIQPGDSREGVGPQRGYDALGGTYGYNWSVNYPVLLDTYGVNALGFNFTRLLGLTPLTLNATLNAAESRGEIKIVSSPKVRTLDNKLAMIKQGIDYPIKQYDGDGNTVITYKEVDLLLEVTPHVTQDRRISMQIKVTKNDVGTVISGEQSFNTKQTDTELLVNDGDTVVIGGIIKTTFREDHSGWPVLNEVPVLGWLFKNTEKADDREELLLFITPTIVELEEVKPL